ncbi:MAG: fibronectin type III domain-containing protein, partial [Verrucomicrobiota bacterium]|nr:fibronectin type III domain-containing protein [Verrucomicrobiota bacterium]
MSESPARGEVIRDPYIQLTTRSSSVVAWRTDQSIAPRVRYGPAPGNLSQSVPAEQIVLRVSPEMKGLPEVPRLGQSTPEGVYQFEATVSELAVDSKYYYGVFDGDTLLAGGTEDSFFHTQPRVEPGRPLRFWVVGDTGDGG